MKISNNVSPADNQQERLIGWILGFVDGEGCFSINFTKQPDRQEKTRIRRGYKTGYQVSHHFAVTQGARSVDALKMIKNFFSVGQIYRNRRHDNHKEDLFSFKVGKRADLLSVIIPFFEKNTLQTSKQNDFVLFAKCVKSMSRKEHLNTEGVVKMARLTQLMNHKKSRMELIRILRDYTPSSIIKDREDIVPSA